MSLPEGMVPAAQLQPTIELLHLLRNRYSAVIHPTSVQDINTEISRLQFILVNNQLQMPYTSGTPGSRTHYTIDITAREKEACERFSNGNYLPDDPSLVDDVLRKIALLPKKVVAEPSAEGVKPPL